MPDDTVVSLRAYGHQSPRKAKDCRDTALLVPFAKAAENRNQISALSAGLQAQGYTPITHVLGLAADDLKPLSGKKSIVLVSDGKETYEGDPCVLARKLAEADAELVIHTVGFDVDDQTRRQLQCIAKAGRGEYRDAANAPDLSSMLQEAVAAAEKPLVASEITVAATGPGILAVENGQFHNVYNAETGERVGAIGNGIGQIELPAGVYNVEFGDNLLWKSIEVVAGETTTIRAAVLKIANNQFHSILDAETGQEVGEYANTQDFIALPPGRYDVTFDKALWGEIDLAEGETETLKPGGVAFVPAEFRSIFNEAGEKVAVAATGAERVMLPPGKYKVSVKGTDIPFEIRENEIVRIATK